MKYRDITQLGRYFSISLNEKTTRLYTTVNFLVEENTKFLEKHLKMYKSWLEHQQEIEPEMKNQESKLTYESGEEKNESTEKVMVKKRSLPPI